MKRIIKAHLNNSLAILKSGGVGVMPTDTVYGIVGSVLSEKTVSRIYRVRHRHSKKPMIILIGSKNDLKLFNIGPERRTSMLLRRFWPGKVSVILPCSDNKFRYLHRGSGSLAFRLPKPQWLRNFLKKSGPLAAPSANPEGLEPARTATEAKKYFGGKVDFYLDGGRLAARPSRLVKIEKNKILTLRR